MPDSVLIYKEGGVSLAAKSFISTAINDIHQDKLLEEAGIQQSQIDSIQSQKLPFRSIDLKNNQETNTEIASMIGYGMGLLIYLILFIYGAGVMRGVMEEKTNRIAEVIISSVRPFQLMMGKIIGIALVGLTQFLIWGVIMILLNFLLPFLIPDLQGLTPGNLSAMPAGAPNIQDIQNNESLHFIQTAMNQNWGLIIGAFLFYFLGGYFMYASMFAAVGSLVNEDMQDAQQMTIPISMPIIFAFIIMAATAENPNSPLAIFGSLFPLTSPIVMMARIPYDVPGWQLGLSMLFLVIGFIGMTWISGKIYRTGILMYGKKITWKEVFKWLRYH
jgi:ABC-2 type transport system permease protein